jgi:hypothetical protein
LCAVHCTLYHETSVKLNLEFLNYKSIVENKVLYSNNIVI